MQIRKMQPAMERKKSQTFKINLHILNKALWKMDLAWRKTKLIKLIGHRSIMNGRSGKVEKGELIVVNSI
jgi:hypothetical protein